jgi:hypothetical protein
MRNYGLTREESKKVRLTIKSEDACGEFQQIMM